MLNIKVEITFDMLFDNSINKRLYDTIKRFDSVVWWWVRSIVVEQKEAVNSIFISIFFFYDRALNRRIIIISKIRRKNSWKMRKHLMLCFLVVATTSAHDDRLVEDVTGEWERLLVGCWWCSVHMKNATNIDPIYISSLNQSSTL